ncbi:MAG: hypothetical protein RLZZ463_1423 [Bacteroidota bacterium]
MKFSLKYIGVLLLVFAVSCVKQVAEKPDHLLSESEMESLVYDLVMFKSVQSYASEIQRIVPNPEQTMYGWYGLDSLSYVQNDRYYAAQPEVYEGIYNRVMLRIDREKEALDARIKEALEKAQAEKSTQSPPTTKESASRQN